MLLVSVPLARVCVFFFFAILYSKTLSLAFDQISNVDFTINEVYFTVPLLDIVLPLSSIPISIAFQIDSLALEQSFLEVADVVAAEISIELLAETVPLIFVPHARVLIQISFCLFQDSKTFSAAIADFTLVQPVIRVYFSETFDLTEFESAAVLDETFRIVDGACEGLAVLGMPHTRILAF